MAPEVLNDSDMSRTAECDVYGFGILLWELLSGQKPFEAGMCENIFLGIRRKLIKFLGAVFYVNFSEICYHLNFSFLSVTGRLTI